MVRRTQVDNLYRMIRCQFLERIVRARHAQQIACRFSAVRRTSEHALYGNAQSAQGLEVCAPDKPQTDDRRIRLHARFPSCSTYYQHSLRRHMKSFWGIEVALCPECFSAERS